ncbi:MAG: AsmA-like C-terminal region-containing protein, partial [Acetobacteraceae bacterium]
LEAPLTARGDVRHGPKLEVQGGRVELSAGGGRILPPGGGEMPIASARAVLEFAGGAVTIEQAQAALPGRAGPSPTLTLAGSVRREGRAWHAEGRVSVDRVAFADLPSLWPAGLGSNERTWITENITDGVALDARFEGAVRFDGGAGVLEPLAFSGSGRVEGATVHYLRPMPPLTGVSAEASFALDRLQVRARGGAVGAIRADSATIVLSGLDTTPQWADISVRIESSVPDALALLSHPKLDLFARRGAPPAGLTGAGEIDLVLRFPLIDTLGIDAVEARATARIADAGVPDALLGRAIERGRFALQADRAGLRIEGTGALGGLDAAMTYEVDFRAGPASQVIERASLRLAPQPGVAEAFGLALAPYVTGRVGGEARLALRRDRQASVTLRLELRHAGLALPEIGWEKPPGEAATGEATVRLAGARVTAVDAVRLEGAGLAARGRAEFAEGRPRRIEIGSLVLGRSRLSGEVRPPVRDGEPWVASLRGQALDLSRRPRGGGAASDGSPSPPLAVEARFDRVRLVEAEGSETQDVALSLRHDGRRLEALEARGVAGGAWSATVRRGPSGRALELRAEDAGAFLRAAGIFSTMAGGQLAVTGRWDEAQPGEPLVGEATIDEFRLREAPVVGRVLQAMTLYGLVEMARGPGLSFSRLVAPFSYDGRTLELREARAYGASLGFTARGTADLDARRLAMEGTIVPAYVFNALLGQIPLIGRIFSPERGGGLFAATYRAVGSFDDPEVSVNPLAALTPGILRGLFGLFEGGGAATGGGGATPRPAESPGVRPQGGG